MLINDQLCQADDDHTHGFTYGCVCGAPRVRRFGLHRSVNPYTAATTCLTASDFVLSRLRGQPDLLDQSPNTREQDEDWNIEVPVIFEPDGRLNAAQKAIIETDFGMTLGQLVVPSRRALVKHVS